MPRKTAGWAVFALLGMSACRCLPGSDGTDPARKPATTSVRCPFGADPIVGDEARFGRSIELFDAALDGKRYEEALACAQEMTRLAPDDLRGHINRAVALDGLGQFEEARDAYGRALALDPDDPEALRASADQLLRRGTDDALEAAVLQARRGRERAMAAVEAAELAVIESSALNALGRSEEALAVAETALILDSESSEAMVERGIALFELLRFEESWVTLEQARALDGSRAKAVYFLGLLEERAGREETARALLSKAAELDPETYPLAVELSPEAFGQLVDEEIEKLGEAERKALSSTDFSWTELPAREDLSSGEPVLSPTILGLFRPAENESGRDAIVLYRRNLLRICRTEDDLHREVHDTLLHELGHLHGEDDAALRDQGL